MPLESNVHAVIGAWVDQGCPGADLRGHPIRYDFAADSWFYISDGQPTQGTPPRPCTRCLRPPTPEGHDPCLGTIPGAQNACCGHGDVVKAYAQFEGGSVIRFQEALDLFAALGVGPEVNA
jgi:hypothetical protein